jgi:RNA polymerase sigma-70 factor (ECF subfamily)
MSACRPGWVQEERESPLRRGPATLPTSGDTPGEHISLGDQLVAIGHEGADATFRSLYTEHAPTLLGLATALTSGDRGRAEDLVQETMLRAWTHRNHLDIQRRSPRAWLFTITRRLAIDAYRARQARPQETELNEQLALAGQQADACIDEIGVRAAIAALPGPQRQVLTEVYYLDRSVAETARILQIPPGTVRSRTFYGLRALRHALGGHDAGA